ncbi:hypothetical protein LQ953_10645 [Sphingomonas sp. IC-56]|uniref:hypothetical protein n=1 Tax=Sphingomonas sp. IC-56 TaxID=2898529 RepID=UPI001E361BE6|nr:hypothetical protein [Sphingomonas sp. IC-56]MCD2324471.1 hypothetical protein [Sphingomonas sp. IC-56]
MKRLLNVALWLALITPVAFFVSMFGDCRTDVTPQACGASKNATFVTIMLIALTVLALATAFSFRNRS